MPHIHRLSDGRETGPEIISQEEESLHWHAVGDEQTSTDPFGAEHTHVFDGEKTSGPIEQTKGAEMNIETKEMGGSIVEAKQIDRNGVPVGVIKGYIATWDLDRGNDRFVRGAFSESIERHKRTNRPIRLKDHHGRTVGGFPIDHVMEDDVGLLAAGEINLEVQQGRELLALIKQGILSELSIGFSSLEDVIENGIRIIKKAEVWEGSPVDEPMNTNARITEVKSVVPFQDLPLASRDRAWNSDAAIGRVREVTDSEESPSSGYRRAFVWFDRADAENFGAYKLPIADVIDGRLSAVPRGIFAAAAALQGARGGVDIPENERAGVIRHIERYYAKMGLESPFGDEKQFFVADDVKNWTERDIEKFFRGTGMMSKSAAKILADRVDVGKRDGNLTDELGEEIDISQENKELSALIENVRRLKAEVAGL